MTQTTIPNRAVQVIDHLKARGHISQGSAFVEYGSFRLSDAIYRLRGVDADLVPAGTEIITATKRDTQGKPYGEYHLVPTAVSVLAGRSARLTPDRAEDRAEAGARSGD